MRGNTTKQKTVNNPAYVAAANVRNKAFQAVIKLKPQSSLFPWTSVSNLRLCLLQKAWQSVPPLWALNHHQMRYRTWKRLATPSEMHCKDSILHRKNCNKYKSKLLDVILESSEGINTYIHRYMNGTSFFDLISRVSDTRHAFSLLRRLRPRRLLRRNHLLLERAWLCWVAPAASLPIGGW